MYERFNAYRVMWVMVLYDLPMVSSKDVRNYTRFRKKILRFGFEMFQFSMYVRHCSSRENAEVQEKRVRSILPPRGHIGIMIITDKQFGLMKVFHGRMAIRGPEPARQLELF